MKLEERPIIERDVHCPYCKQDKAILINKEVQRKSSFRFAALGLKFILSLCFLGLFHAWRYGFKLFEIVRWRDVLTYVFCPECGRTYTLDPPSSAVRKIETDDKLYRYEDGKVLQGICKGISVLTEIPLLWIRIVSVLHTISIGSVMSAALHSAIPQIIGFIIGVALTVGAYYLLSLMLKVKKSAPTDEVNK